ncbi:NADP-dependent oxidoreductase [Ruania albidiflava]|uniref:NADP-dependent oxidoreductase n=1 Tax=Ruania albidiflava TaxID=366586 RepID=UPI0003B7002B|nr:NADP-dependent oxidoreductase [Ruania albidiflava]
MRAVRYHEYGGPDVLRLEDAPAPEAGPGQVRIAVGASAVNRMDIKLRSGAMASTPLAHPRIPGLDAAGVVDQVGAGVTGVQVGDRVFGAGSATLAELAVLETFAPVPEGLSLVQAAALPTVAETAGRVLSLLPGDPGAVLVVDGAAGGVGTILVQLARRRGLTVVGTASPAKHDVLRHLGALPTTYGPGLVDRVRALVDHVDGAADLAGEGSAGELVTLTRDSARVVTIADFSGATEAVVTDGSDGRSWATMTEVADLVAAGELELLVDTELDWSQAAEAHRRCESGHATGKVVLTLSDTW